MNGQASLELIVTVMAFIAVLGVWVAGMSHVTQEARAGISAMAAESAANQLQSEVNMLCVMSEGSAGAFSSSADAVAEGGSILTLTSGNRTLTRQTLCPTKGTAALKSMVLRREAGHVQINTPSE